MRTKSLADIRRTAGMIPFRIEGIPCLIDVVYYKPEYYKRGPRGEDFFWDEECIEYTIRDRRGYLANWLHAKVFDDSLIIEKIRKHCNSVA